ncbi:hypothetical protein MKW94_017600 [Papaver nudicaule]|uniref:Late embryogenesis abundant protein n=1 Tax=Papaver nudicaule TaxID=74823 RepID=A0AA41S5I2_PAPNU|nr:hypothetical protein [Papaver nudicaule]
MASSRLACALKKCLSPLITRSGFSTSAAENVKTSSVSSTTIVGKKVLQETGKAGNKATIEKESKEVIWTRDPKTGNWMPENHSNEADPADLRNMLLSKKFSEL